MNKKNNKKGVMLVEVLISVFIFSIILGILITINNLYLRGASSNLKSVKATYLAEEGMEALKIIRDTDWDNFYTIPNNTERYFYFSTASSTWTATTAIAYKNDVDSINRWFTLEDSCYAGTPIPSGDMKKATVHVSFEDRGEEIEKTLSSCFTDII